MMHTWLLRGILFGLALAVPVGPISLLCIHLSLRRGRRVGLAFGLGVATADAVYAALAAVGIAALVAPAIGETVPYRIAGGAVLILIGIHSAIRARVHAEGSASVTHRGALAAYVTAILLTLSNPITIMTFAAAFGALGLANEQHSVVAVPSLVAGVWLGSSGWWLVVSSVTAWLGRRLSASILLWGSRCAGAAIAALGAVLIGRAIGLI